MLRLLTLTLLLLSGCTLGWYFDPAEPPTGPGWEPGREAGHYISLQAPVLTNETTFLGLWRHTSWDSGGYPFDSYVFCPGGVPPSDPPNLNTIHGFLRTVFASADAHASCGQTYGGIKQDPTETLRLRQAGIMDRYDYVFSPSEQFALRWIQVSAPSPNNMGGS